MSPKRAPSGGSTARLALVLIVALVPLSRAAAQSFEAKPSLNVSQEWDDNVLSRETDERSSWVTRTRPGITLSARDEKGTLDLDLGLTFRNYWSLRDIDGIDQHYALRGKRKLSDRFEMDLRASHRVADNRDDIFENVDGSDFLIQSERPDVIYDEAIVGARYALTSRTNLVGSFDYERREYDDNRLIRDTQVRDLDTVGGSIGLEHVLTPLDQLSLSYGVSRSDQDPASSVSSVPDQRDELGTLTLAWTRAWSPKWSSRASVGQRWIDAERFDVPVVVFDVQEIVIPGSGSVRLLTNPRAVELDESDSSSGLVGSLSLTRQLPRGDLTFGLSRDARTGGAGATTSSSIEIHTFFAQLSHRLSDRVKLRLSGSFSDYESIGEFDVPILPNAQFDDFCVPGSRRRQVPGATGNEAIWCTVEATSEVDLEQLRLDLQVDWRMRKDINAYARFSLIDQDSKGRTLRSFERHRISVGFRYQFDPE